MVDRAGRRFAALATWWLNSTSEAVSPGRSCFCAFCDRAQRRIELAAAHAQRAVDDEREVRGRTLGLHVAHGLLDAVLAHAQIGRPGARATSARAAATSTMSTSSVSFAVSAAVVTDALSLVLNPFDQTFAVIVRARERGPEVVRDAVRRLARDAGEHAVDGEVDAVDGRGVGRDLDGLRPDRLRAVERRDERDAAPARREAASDDSEKNEPAHASLETSMRP